MRNFASIGMPMDDLERAGNLHIICRYPEAMGLEDLLVTLRMGLEEIEPALVVMDSISAIEHSSSEKGFRQFMIGLASLLREHARGALLTQTVIGSGVATHTAPYLSTIADAILALDYSVGPGDLVRTLRVLKMRGSSHVTYPYRLTLAQGGLQVEPPTIRPRPRPDGGTRSTDGYQPPTPGQDEKPLQGIRILLVEDFQDALEAVTTLLEQAGAEVTPASTSAQGLSWLDQQVPDIIVADIGLPEEDGMAFIRKVRVRPGKEKGVPAVALAGWGLPRDRARAQEAGFQAHLVKPVEPATLVSVVKALAVGSA
jgi:CheY-like chemotaxis protein